MVKDYFKPLKRDFLQLQDISLLTSLVLDCKKKLLELRFTKKIGSIKDVSKFYKLKKNIARAKTEIVKRRIKN